MRNSNRIGILTFHRALNYGAVWQCWALKKACELLGALVETIDYNPYGDYKAKWFIRKRPSIAFKYLKQMYVFNRFVQQYLNPTPHTVSHEWIKDNPPQDDIYIVGSDQVWSNVLAEDYLDSYLLDFAPDNVIRMSYAASTGCEPMVLNEYQLSELRKFSFISVRERQSVADVQQKVEVAVTDVCDPTLLLTKEDYVSIEKKPLLLPKHYIAYYDLAGDSFCAETAKRLSKELRLPILNLAGGYKRWARYNYTAPTPEQWLYILHHADFVCTNSFHGVALSIDFRRPFIYCEAHNAEHSKKISRIQNILTQTNLMNRYAEDIQQVQNIIICGEVIYDETAIEEYRNRSLEWLKNAIEL